VPPIPFRRGEVVRLKSHRRQMQVEETGISVATGRPTVWCVWMEGGEERRDAFDPDELEASG
jgi:uncharacterized protein YodC (DUF2158 family)